jgi:hypothetical protein
LRSEITGNYHHGWISKVLVVNNNWRLAPAAYCRARRFWQHLGSSENRVKRHRFPPQDFRSGRAYQSGNRHRVTCIVADIHHHGRIIENLEPPQERSYLRRRQSSNNDWIAR